MKNLNQLNQLSILASIRFLLARGNMTSAKGTDCQYIYISLHIMFFFYVQYLIPTLISYEDHSFL